MWARVALMAVLSLSLLVGCTAAADDTIDDAELFMVPTGTGEPLSTDPTTSIVAEVTGPAVDVFATPGASTPIARLTNPNENGAPLVFLGVSYRDDWLEVLLPVRPNGSRGWVRKQDVALTAHRYRLRVELARHRITVWNGTKPILQEPIGVGGNRRPTPTGVYYLTELLRPPNPDGLYGPYAFGISGYSDVLTSFRGGDGGVGIHGTNDPSSIGGDSTHGCIRLNNDAITRLAHILPLGTPVFIRE
jgi:lipoprotein-anchoring transpeptidase ErfK/SrfK